MKTVAAAAVGLWLLLSAPAFAQKMPEGIWCSEASCRSSG